MQIEKLNQKIAFFRNMMIRPKRLLNFLIKEAEIKLGATRLHYYPNAMTIDIGNVCNLKCPLCPTGRGDKGVSKGFMTLKNYKRLIDDIGPFLTSVDLHNWGEPLLNKDLIPMIRYAKVRGIAVNISSNLMRLDETTAYDLMRTGIDKIFISLDAASPETYNSYRIGGDFDRVMRNLRFLIQAKKELNNRYTRLKILFHVFSHNEHEVEKIKTLSTELGVELSINMIRPDMGKEVFDDARQAIERDGEWLPENPDYCPFDMETKEKKVIRPCKELWKTTVVNWDGSVLPCCSVYGEKYQFGNAFDTSFREVWNNPVYIAARNEVRGKIDNSGTICHVCRQTGYLHF